MDISIKITEAEVKALVADHIRAKLGAAWDSHTIKITEGAYSYDRLNLTVTLKEPEKEEQEAA